MINLLKVCNMLKKPSNSDIEERKVHLGPSDRTKLLILDMDETMLHSKFSRLTGQEGPIEPIIAEDPNGVLEFNVAISNRPNEPPSILLNVKLRQHLEEALSYLSTMYEICVFTAGE